MREVGRVAGIVARHGSKLIVKLGALAVAEICIVAFAYGSIWISDERIEGARLKTTQATMRELLKAADHFKTEHGRYPEKLEDLVYRPAYAKAENWPKGGYLSSLPKDGWDRDFVYRPRPDGTGFTIGSLGPDGREGGDCDLWEGR
ncbi:MAG: type II secretion system protein GspG [Planctomycetes bacterium]|nr:type II secretion system protein GspG [Planctomycetota bacterium]